LAGRNFSVASVGALGVPSFGSHLAKAGIADPNGAALILLVMTNVPHAHPRYATQTGPCVFLWANPPGKKAGIARGALWNL
jgi:hypothetical protein